MQLISPSSRSLIVAASTVFLTYPLLAATSEDVIIESVVTLQGSTTFTSSPANSRYLNAPGSPNSPAPTPGWTKYQGWAAPEHAAMRMVLMMTERLRYEFTADDFEKLSVAASRLGSFNIATTSARAACREYLGGRYESDESMTAIAATELTAIDQNEATFIREVFEDVARSLSAQGREALLRYKFSTHLGMSSTIQDYHATREQDPERLMELWGRVCSFI
jgi:hypothetical protein